MKRFITSIVLMLTSQLTSLSQQGICCSGLQASWSFYNGSGADSSGKGHQLPLWGLSPCTDRFGRVNSAYRFDNGPNAPVMSANGFPDMSEFTLSLWVKFKNISSNRIEPLINKNPYWALGIDHVNSGENELLPTGNYLVFTINSTSFYSFNPFAGSPEGKVPSDTFFHVTIQYNGLGDTPSLFFYINGELTNSYSLSTLLQWPTLGPNVVIGSNNIVNHPGFAGSLDDINIYDRIVDRYEIQRLYKDTTNHISCQPTMVGVEDVEKELRTKIYPNPASDFFCIEGENIIAVNLYSTLGQFIKSQLVSATPARINVDDIKAGVYILEAVSHFDRTRIIVLVQ